jgi:hypothetical protein
VVSITGIYSSSTIDKIIPQKEIVLSARWSTTTWRFKSLKSSVFIEIEEEFHGAVPRSEKGWQQEWQTTLLKFKKCVEYKSKKSKSTQTVSNSRKLSIKEDELFDIFTYILPRLPLTGIEGTDEQTAIASDLISNKNLSNSLAQKVAKATLKASKESQGDESKFFPLCTKYYKDQAHKAATKKEQDLRCFIATAIYGHSYHPSVCILREFRDNTLSKSFFGRIIIQAYYKIGPIASSYIKTESLIGQNIKKILDRMVYKIGKMK